MRWPALPLLTLFVVACAHTAPLRPSRPSAPRQVVKPVEPEPLLLSSATRPHDCEEGRTRVTQVGRTPSPLRELSGLTASRRHPGLFWAHNDSDNSFVLYALDTEAQVHAAFPIVGVEPLDVEAIAVAPCDAGTCLLLADIGDNDAKRAQVRLLRLPEPEQLDSRELIVEPLTFAYEDGPRDAESLVVDRAGTIYVLTKPLGAIARVYRLEGLGPRRTGRAVHVGTLPAQGVLQRAATDASLSPDSSRLLVRTYFGVWLWEVPNAADFESLIATTPREVNGPTQPQGEAVAFLPDGSGYLLGSEEAGAPFFRVDCLPAPQGLRVSSPGAP